MSETNKSVLDTVLEPQEVLGVSITVAEIQAKIALLAQLPTENLKEAMGELKLALRANPEACNLMLPEDIGALVAGLYRATNQKIQVENAKSTVKQAKKVDLSKVDLNQLSDF